MLLETEPLLKNDVFLKDVCTFGIGGLAKHYLEVRTIEQLKDALKYCKNNHLNYFVLGKGSNCLFDDRGFNGLVIHNKIDFKQVIAPGKYHVGAGFNFSLLGSQTARDGFSGLEFASGIPASVGGAVFMNAGANGGETFDYLVSVDYLNDDGEIVTLPKNKIFFGYRTTAFQKMKGVIVAATFELTPSCTARAKQLEIISYRVKTQPYNDKSAGCIFRNHACATAGLLIDQSNLKGFSCGGAFVSDMHANFIVNKENATAQDVLNLIAEIKKRVLEKTGYELESEVRYIPFDPSKEIV